MSPLPAKLLFTPGPLSTSRTVKESMLRDLGSRDAEFVEVVARVRDGLLAVAGTSRERGWDSVPLQGAGTFALEAVVGSALPKDGALLVLANGTYGVRLAEIAERLGIRSRVLAAPEDRTPDPRELERALAADAGLTHVAVIHCESTTGILNPLEELGRVVRRHGRRFLVDAMSSFGAIPIDVEGACVDFLVSSSNKCIEGVPGLAFVLARRAALEECAGRARSFCLDLHAQWRAFDESGQFRFTPPTHAMLAFERALDELGSEGGVAARAARYRANHRVLVEGMRALGFRCYLSPELQSPLVVTFRYPDDPRFVFADFHRGLSERGFELHPQKLSSADCFRIAALGQITPDDVRALVAAIPEVLAQMGVELDPDALASGERLR